MAWALPPPTHTRPRRLPRACATNADNASTDHAALITAAPLRLLPYPGESITVSLSSDELRALAASAPRNTPMRALLLQPPSGSSAASALLSVSGARPIGGGAEADATAVCRAHTTTSNARIVTATRLHDWPPWDANARTSLASAMCDAATMAGETRALRARLGAVDAGGDAWARLRACAPDSHDMELSASEWTGTPAATRETWCRRAELFSFAVVRYAGLDSMSDSHRAEIWTCTETLYRVKIAIELLVVARSEAAAKVSIRNALTR